MTKLPYKVQTSLARTSMKAENKPPAYESPKNAKLKRGLEHRHLQMIALGGTIGTGLFVGSGASIGFAGPLAVLIVYLIVGVLCYAVGTSSLILVSAVGEMGTQVPITGAFGEITARFLDPAVGFALGWNYYFQWLLVLPAEIAVFGSIPLRWVPRAADWHFTAVGLAMLIFLNLLGVKVFGEIEYWLSMIKIVTIVVFIIIGTALVFGASSDLGFVGFKNWNPANVPDTPITSFPMFMNVFVSAFYSYAGTELIGVTVGEAKNPSVSVPRAIKGTVWRILGFYILSLLVIGLLIPRTDDAFNGHATVLNSPFTKMLEFAGIPGAPDIMNAVILCAIFSAANGAIYASTRTLQSLAANNMAPQWLVRTTSNGIPVYTVAISFSVGIIALVGGFTVGNGVVFHLLAGILSMSFLLCWIVILLTHLRFRWGWRQQGRSDAELIYRAPFFPYIDIFGIAVAVVVCAMIIYNTCTAPEFDYVSASPVYGGLPFIFSVYAGYKVYEILYSVPNRGLVPFDQMDFDDAGNGGITEELEIDTPEEPELKTWIRKTIDIIS